VHRIPDAWSVRVYGSKFIPCANTEEKIKENAGRMKQLKRKSYNERIKERMSK
jgi:hypothetical protein